MKQQDRRGSSSPFDKYAGPGGPGNIIEIWAQNAGKRAAEQQNPFDSGSGGGSLPLAGGLAPSNSNGAQTLNQMLGGRSDVHGVLEQILNPPHGGPAVDPGIVSKPRPVDPRIATNNSRGGLGGGLGGGPDTVDYAAMAAKIYQPNLDFLTGQEKLAQQRNVANDKSLAGMYAGLVNDIGRSAKGIAQNYDQGAASVGQAAAQTDASINNTYDQSAAEQAAMLKHLGIEAAAPDTLKQNTRDEAFFKGLIDTNANSVKNMLAQQKAGALEYNTAQQNISRQSGADARATNKLNLEDTLQQILGQKANLQTQIGQEAVSMQNSAASNLMKQMQMAQQQANADRAAQDREAQLMLNKSKFEADQKNAANSQANSWSKDPWVNIQNAASKLYPDTHVDVKSGRTPSQNAVKAIMDTVQYASQNGQTFASPNEFIHAVLTRNRGANDAPQLTQLATLLYQQMYGH